MMSPVVARRNAYLAVVISLVSLAIALLGNVTVYITRSQVAKVNCDRVEELKSYFRESIARSNQAISDSAYYQSHPEELQERRRANQLALNDLAPVDCGKTFLPWG